MNTQIKKNYFRPQILVAEIEWGGVALCASNNEFQSSLEDWSEDTIE